MKVDSVKKRFIVTLLANVFKLIVGLVNSTIVPRSLGAVDYGNYQFIYRSFTSIRGFLNLGTTAAFFTYSSKNIKSSRAFIIFFGWTIIQLFFIILLIIASIIFKFNVLLFPDQITFYIIIIAILEWLNFFSANLIQFGETKAESVYVQKINFTSNFVKLSTTVSLYIFGVLNLNSFIIINYIGSVLILIYLLIFFLGSKKKGEYFEKTKKNEYKSVINYFVNYCTPLIIYEFFGFFYNYFDRWLLQFTSGSVQQAYFSLSFQWATISMLFTTSVANIFWREISYSFSQKDFKRISDIYIRSTRTLFFLSTYLCFILVFQAENLVKLFISKEFSDSIIVIQIMAFYPIFITLSTLNTNFFYATEKVKLYRNIAISGMVFSIVISYFLIVPSNLWIPGFGLQAKGAAISYILNTLIFTFIQTIFISKILGFKLYEVISSQLTSLVILGIISCVLYIFLKYFQVINYVNFVGFCLFYTVVVFILVYFRPNIAGLTKSEIIKIKVYILNRLNKSNK